MAFQFPWTNLHELNLDWFLSKFKQFANNYLATTATVELIPTTEQPEVTVTGGTLDDDTDIVDPFNFHFKIPQGMGILSLTITYNVTNTDTEPTTGWTTSKPAVNPGQYLWIKQTIIMQNGVGQSYTYFVYYPVDGTTPTINIDEYPTENSPNAVSSGGVWSDINNLKDLTSDNFAWVETTNTASRAYVFGDYFVNKDGVLCQITTASVSSGSTLTENINYVTVGGNGGVLAPPENIAVTSNYNIIENNCIRVGGYAICKLQIQGTANTPITPGSEIAQLQYKPASSVRLYGFLTNDISNANAIVDIAGKVKIYFKSSASNPNIWLSGFFKIYN